MEIPTEIKDIDNLSKEHALSYNEIALIVGSLYLDSHHKISSMNKDFESILQETQNIAEQKSSQLQAKVFEVQSMQKKIESLKNENFKLQEKIDKILKDDDKQEGINEENINVESGSLDESDNDRDD